jgi:3-deoxy-D-manno-octulosonic acid kinase
MLVVNPAYNAVSEAWFDPAHWGAHAQPVSTGGRGSAWFLETDQGDMVLRHYRRGGLVARLSERSYVYTGRRNTRAFQEFELLKALHEQGLPVPEPVAAYAHRSFVLYQAALMIRRIPGAVPLPEVGNLEDESLWREVGKTIRRFHDAGLDHVDLNCDNLLVSAGDVFLIDFDRCQFKCGDKGSRWRKANLDRLWRSIKKRIGPALERQTSTLWNCLMSGYDHSPESA